MKNKTCGECKCYDMHGGCNKLKNTLWIHSTNIACIKFEAKNPTNGDRIRQGGDDALIDFADGIRRRMCHYCVYSKDKSCVDKAGDCWEGVRAWLNAPAESKESEGKE